MLKDAAADDVTFGQWKISQLCSNLKETVDRSGDVGDKKQKSWLGYWPALELSFGGANICCTQQLSTNGYFEEEEAQVGSPRVGLLAL